MSRWLGDGGMPILAAIGVSFDDYGIEDDDKAGVHAVVLDAAMIFAVNAGLLGRDRTGAALELKTETMRSAAGGERLAVRGAVMRQTKQVAFAEARIEDAKGRLVSRSTGTFLVQRD